MSSYQFKNEIGPQLDWHPNVPARQYDGFCLLVLENTLAYFIRKWNVWRGKSQNGEDLQLQGLHAIVIKHLPISMDNIDLAHCFDLNTYWGSLLNFLGPYLR